MIMPMIDTLDANCSYDNNFLPATDKDARILFMQQDGEVSEHEVFNAYELDSYDDKNEFMFKWQGGNIPKWKVFITDQRMIVWNPFSKGLIGKPKEKSGKSTGGHLLFSSMVRMGAWIGNDGDLFLAGMCFRDKGKRKTMFVLNADESVLRDIACELNKRINSYMEKKGLTLSEDSDMFKKNPDIKKNWESFHDDIFRNKDGEVNIMIPMSEFALAPNDRF